MLEECARFNQDVVAPLNVAGDRNPSSFKDGAVTTTPGFKEAYQAFWQAGWPALACAPEDGGQGRDGDGPAGGRFLNFPPLMQHIQCHPRRLKLSGKVRLKLAIAAPLAPCLPASIRAPRVCCC